MTGRSSRIADFGSQGYKVESMSSSRRVGVVFGGQSPEHDISILTGLQAARHLADSGVDVQCLYWTKSGAWQKVPVAVEAADFLEPEVNGASSASFGVPGGFMVGRRRAKPLAVETVLNCCHGGPGEDGSLAALLMMAGIRVTGPGPGAATLAMDKLASAAVAESEGVPTIETALWSPESNALDGLPARPWVVKPRWGGSSIGVEAGVEDADTVAALAHRGVGRAGILVQPFLNGWVDLNVAVRSYPTMQCSPVERPLLGDATILGYQEKYLTGSAGMESALRELPADIPAAIREEIFHYAVVLMRSMGLTGAPRFDFLWDGGSKVVFCEVNPIPGAWGTYLWRESGTEPLVLYEDLLAEAVSSPTTPYQWLPSSDGRALRQASSIASKLL